MVLMAKSSMTLEVILKLLTKMEKKL